MTLLEPMRRGLDFYKFEEIFKKKVVPPIMIICA
jgi:hypothetical protein